MERVKSQRIPYQRPLGAVFEKEKKKMLDYTFKAIKRELLRTKTLKRSTRLQPWMLGKQFNVHSGKTFQLVEVVRLRLESLVGEYVPTRKSPLHKKKKRK